MKAFDDWISDNTGTLQKEFFQLYEKRIKEEWDFKFRDSYPIYEDFLEEESFFITDTLLESEWVSFVSESHTSYLSSIVDRDYDLYKDEEITNK